jgi:hypothetical protein
MNPLPNKYGLWHWGVSLNTYSEWSELVDLPGSFAKSNTEHGQAIHDFKYKSSSTGTTRSEEIVNFFFGEIRRVFEYLGKDHKDAPFDLCIAPPMNLDGHPNLPLTLCARLANQYAWMQAGLRTIEKTRTGLVMKNTSRNEREAAVSGLYRARRNLGEGKVTGILIIDDVFETGSTVNEICRALEVTYPGIPRYVVALTDLGRAL